MALFLNTSGIASWIEQIIDETERELIILSPYLQLSNSIYNKLFATNQRGVETTFVYRENQLTENQKEKLKTLDNLNLMHHPNLHAKCFYNEKYLLIASMNLYEYSIKNNREMGVLIHWYELEESGRTIDSDASFLFEDAIKEIKLIVNSSHMEKPSRETQSEGFDMDIIKSEKELVEQDCIKLNKYFGHKKLEAFLHNDSYVPKCFNYFERIDIMLDYRIQLDFHFDATSLNRLHFNYAKFYNEFMFEGFKFYWNDYQKYVAYLYKDQSHPIWGNTVNEKDKYTFIQNTLNQFYELMKSC